jgi:hypothetical protein
MKKQLIIVSFLIASFSLWGMEGPNTDYKEMLEILKVPKIEYMLADTSEKKEALSLNLFKQFNQKVFEYFKQDQTEKNRIAILTWNKKWLTLFVVFNDEEVFNFISASLDHPDKAVKNLDQVVKCFLFIYKMYLEKHPEQLCNVLLAYFRRDLMDNQYYRKFLQVMLIMFRSLFNYVVAHSQLKGSPAIKVWQQSLDDCDKYITEYEDLNDKDFLFILHHTGIENICKQVNKSLQKMRQTEESESVLSVPIVSMAAQAQQYKGPQELPIVETSVPLPENATNTEGKSEATFWSKLADGWNRLSNMLKLISGV